MKLRAGLLVAVVALALPSLVAAQGRTGSSSPGQVAFNEGMNALNGDDYAAAEQKFTEAIHLDSTLVDAYWRLASIHYRNKQYGKAVELLRRSPDKGNLEVKQQLALNLYKTATPPPPEAVKLLEEVTQARPESFAAQLQLGQHLVKSDPKRAAAALELYFKHRPADAAAVDDSVRSLLGTAYIYAKEWDQATREFETLSRQKPNDLVVRLYLASALVGKGDLKACSQAIALLERVLPESQKQPSIHFNLGSCYLKVNRAADAEREATAYTKARAQDLKGHVLLGDTLFAQRRYDKALLAYQAARALDKNAISVLTKIGLTDVELGNMDAAIAELEKAEASAGPGMEGEVLCALTRAYAKKGLKDKLLARADRLAATQSVPSQLCAGQAYFMAGSDDKATQSLEDVLRNEPQHSGARAALVKVQNRRAGAAVEKGELPRALGLLTDAQKLLPDDLMTNRNLGLVLVLSKRHAEAIEVFGRVLKKLGKPDMVVNRLLGRAYLGLGKRAEARAELEKAAQIALRVRGVDLAGVYSELGPLYTEIGQHDQAVTVLEQAVKEAPAVAPGGSPVAGSVAQVAQRNLALAYFARAIARLSEKEGKQTDLVLEDLGRAAQAPKGVLVAKESLAVTCFQGVAALKAARFADAADAFRRAQAGGGCALKPAYERLGTGFFVAYAGYRDGASPRAREDAAKTFGAQLGKVSGPTGELLRQLVRSAYELLGYDYFQKSDEKKAEASLKAALKVPSRGERRELDHNLAVLDLAGGRAPQAERALEALQGKPAESLVNLGIIKDRQGDGKAALQLYRRAWERGVRVPKLKEWIDVKERLYGGAS